MLQKKTNSFIKKWSSNVFEDFGGGITPEYNAFQRGYKNVLVEIGNENGFELESFNKMHYEFSAVMKSVKSGKFYYISISDVRYFFDGWKDCVLYRTMEHEEDWKGGTNNYSSLVNLGESLRKLDDWQIRHDEYKSQVI